MGVEQGRLRRAVNVGVDQPDAFAHPRQRTARLAVSVGFADPALPDPIA